MLLLHERLQANLYPNCHTMAQELSVSSKTIQRDLEFMRDRLGLPIIFKRSRGGYCYSEPVTSLPGSTEVTGSEVLALFIAQKAVAQYHGTAFEKQLSTAFRKLADSLPSSFSFQWGKMDPEVSFQPLGMTVEAVEIFEKVSQAVRDSRELTFRYQKLNASEFELRRLQPYHLGSIENQWYVIGFDLRREQLRTFALSRIQEAKLEEQRFTRPEEFSIAELLRNSFGVFAGGPNHHQVRLRFEPSVAQLIAERVWHGSQKLTTLPGGEVELAMELCSLREVERWILSWGPRVRVLQPPELARSLREKALQIANLYPPEGAE